MAKSCFHHRIVRAWPGNSTAPTCVTSVVGLLSPAVVGFFDTPMRKAVSISSTRNADVPGKGNSYEFQERYRQRHDRRLLRRRPHHDHCPGIRSAEAAAAHHGQMLRHRNEG